MYDVAIIGAGITGCAIAYELGKYNVKAVIVEKENDVSVGTTKANSAIIHGGYDPKPGTKMAEYNIKGNGYKVTGNGCPRGAAYGEKELVNPTRVITSTVRVEAKTARRVPVKTASDIPKGKIYDIMKELDKVTMKAPVAIGDVVIPNVLGLGVDVVACKKVAE